MENSQSRNTVKIYISDNMDAKCIENSQSVSDSLVTVGVPRAADDSGQTEQSDTVQYLTTPEPEKTLQMMPK